MFYFASFLQAPVYVAPVPYPKNDDILALDVEDDPVVTQAHLVCPHGRVSKLMGVNLWRLRQTLQGSLQPCPDTAIQGFDIPAGPAGIDKLERHGLRAENLPMTFASPLTVILSGLTDAGQITRAGGGQKVFQKGLPFLIPQLLDRLGYLLESKAHRQSAVLY
jgi:hypothetical protein